MKVGIIGCGRMGKKRASALGDHPLIAVADIEPASAREMARQYSGVEAESDWRRLVERRDLDAVVVSTSHDALADIALAAVRAGKQVLVEKPGARRMAELDPLIAEARARSRVVHVGFNHRYHPAIRRARELACRDEAGPMMFVRARYGHGGRVGYDREWRANPAISGGGELLDQGIHLIDLSRWFLGEFAHVGGHIATYFWDMPVEDNAFMTLRTPAGQTAWLHASWTEWKNLFSFEIYTKYDKFHVEGLGGSYGVERLTHYHMKPAMGPPDARVEEFPGEDLSWRHEFESFVRAVREGHPAEIGLQDARAALEVVQKIYEAVQR